MTSPKPLQCRSTPHQRWLARLPARTVLAVGALLLPAAGASAQGLPPSQAAACAPCHGPQGNPTQPLMAALAGQSARYIELQLRDYQDGRRSNPQMSLIARDLTRDEMRALGRWFAAQARQALPFQPDPALARLGKVKADEALCTVCHLGGFAGQHEIPRVAGQPMDYVLQQLRAFKSGERSNDGGNMSAVTRLLTDLELQQIAHHLAGL